MSTTDHKLLAVTARLPMNVVESWTPPEANSTTKRHPRTLHEAFNDADRATWFYADQDNPWTWRLLGVAVVAVACVAACVLLVGAAS